MPSISSYTLIELKIGTIQGDETNLYCTIIGFLLTQQNKDSTPVCETGRKTTKSLSYGK